MTCGNCHPTSSSSCGDLNTDDYAFNDNHEIFGESWFQCANCVRTEHGETIAGTTTPDRPTPFPQVDVTDVDGALAAIEVAGGVVLLNVITKDDASELAAACLDAPNSIKDVWSWEARGMLLDAPNSIKDLRRWEASCSMPTRDLRRW
jgi:hypothetical protein